MTQQEKDFHKFLMEETYKKISAKIHKKDSSNTSSRTDTIAIEN